MQTEKYLAVTARRVPRNKNARFLEDQFSDIVSKAVRQRGGKISNWSVDWQSDPKNFTFSTMVWREVDSPFATTPLNKPNETDLWLRRATKSIKRALADYTKVEVALITTNTTEEKL